LANQARNGILLGKDSPAALILLPQPFTPSQRRLFDGEKVAEVAEQASRGG
jgi:hypothetical protein